jgi:excisionase family DNA binding protein
MEGLVIVKASDMEQAFIKLFAEVHALRQEVEELRDKERELKAYTAEEAAKLIGYHPKTIRKMVRRKILSAVQAVSGKGTYRITWKSIQAFLTNRTQREKLKK